MTATTITNRETWLEALTAELVPIFAQHGAKIPRCRFSLGFTSKGGKGKAIGECWTDKVSADETHEIFLRCDRDDSEDIAATLVHELIHAVVGVKEGHGAPFKRLARRLHLEGKLTATTGGEAFKEMVAPALEKIGPVPHKRLDFSRADGPKKQKGRLVKCQCPECEYSVRMTRVWLDDPAYGAPVCPACDYTLVPEETQEPD